MYDVAHTEDEGNEMFTYLQPHNVDIITEAVVSRATEVCPAMEEEVSQAMKPYNTLFKDFGKCHNQYNSGRFLTDTEIDSLG